MTKTPFRPFLLGKDDSGQVSLTIREIRYNSQNYPLVTSTLHPTTFATANAARAYAKEHFGAQAGQFATK